MERETIKFLFLRRSAALSDHSSRWCAAALPAHEVVILTVSHEPVSRLAHPGALNPKCGFLSDTLRVGRTPSKYQNSVNPACIGISANTRADAVAQGYRLSRSLSCVQNPVGTRRELQSILRFTVEEGCGKLPPCLHRGLERHASSALENMRTGNAKTRAWLFRLSCEPDDLRATCEEIGPLGHFFNGSSKYSVERTVCFSAARCGKFSAKSITSCLYHSYT